MSAVVHQLTDEEVQRHYKGIIHFGAVGNINIINKEDALMIEKLEAYRAELESKKLELENAPIDVEAEVAAFREKLVAEIDEKRKAEIAKLAANIECLDGIIASEKEKELAAAAEVVEAEVVE